MSRIKSVNTIKVSCYTFFSTFSADGFCMIFGMKMVNVMSWKGLLVPHFSFIYSIGLYFHLPGPVMFPYPHSGLLLCFSFIPLSLWQTGGRAGEAAEQQQVSRYHSFFYTLLEYHFTLAAQWYSPVTLWVLSHVVHSFYWFLGLIINAMYTMENWKVTRPQNKQRLHNSLSSCPL